MVSKLQSGLLGGALGGGAGRGLGGLIGLLDKGRGGKRYDKDILELYGDLDLPEYVIKDLIAAQIPLTGLMSPEQWEAALPGDPSLIADSPEMRAEQVQAISGLREISEEGLPEADRLAAEEGARSRPRPVLTPEDIARLAGKSDAMVAAALEVARTFPGSRVVQ